MVFTKVLTSANVVEAEVVVEGGVNVGESDVEVTEDVHAEAG